MSSAAKADPKEVSSYFAKRIVPLIAPDKRKLVVLALQEIIINDESISMDTIVELVNGATKNALRKQSKFVLADFLAGIFLYTATINNRIGKKATEFVTDEFVQSFSDLEESIFFIQHGDGLTLPESLLLPHGDKSVSFSKPNDSTYACPSNVFACSSDTSFDLTFWVCFFYQIAVCIIFVSFCMTQWICY